MTSFLGKLVTNRKKPTTVVTNELFSEAEETPFEEITMTILKPIS